MATREARFRQAAVAYAAYGVAYWLGGLYLAAPGIGVGRGLVWLVLGALFVLAFPWLIARGTRGAGYLWFTRILTVAVAWRAIQAGRVALAPRFPSIPLPGGGELPMSLAAAVFALIALGATIMLARAAWGPRA